MINTSSISVFKSGTVSINHAGFTFPIYKLSLAEQSSFLKIILYLTLPSSLSYMLFLPSVLHINFFSLFLGSKASLSLAYRHIAVWKTAQKQFIG